MTIRVMEDGRITERGHVGVWWYQISAHQDDVTTFSFYSPHKENTPPAEDEPVSLMLQGSLDQFAEMALDIASFASKVAQHRKAEHSEFLEHAPGQLPRIESRSEE